MDARHCAQLGGIRQGTMLSDTSEWLVPARAFVWTSARVGASSFPSRRYSMLKPSYIHLLPSRHRATAQGSG